MKRRFSYLVLAAALLASGAASAAPTGMTQMPAEFRANGVFVPVRLNGGTAVWMKLDIAQDNSVLAAGARTANLALGPIAVSNVQFANDRAIPCAGPDGRAIAGTLGEGFLGDRILVIKYREHQVWISAPVEPPNDALLASTASYRTAGR